MSTTEPPVGTVEPPVGTVEPSDVDRVEPTDVDRVEPSDVDRVEPSDVDRVEPTDVDRVEPIDVVDAEVECWETIVFHEREKKTVFISKNGDVYNADSDQLGNCRNGEYVNPFIITSSTNHIIQ